MSSIRLFGLLCLLGILAGCTDGCCGGGVTTKAWGTATLIETDNAGSASAPQIAFDASGNALAVCSQSDGTRNNIWANRFQ